MYTSSASRPLPASAATHPGHPHSRQERRGPRRSPRRERRSDLAAAAPSLPNSSPPRAQSPRTPAPAANQTNAISLVAMAHAGHRTSEQRRERDSLDDDGRSRDEADPDGCGDRARAPRPARRADVCLRGPQTSRHLAGSPPWPLGTLSPRVRGAPWPVPGRQARPVAERLPGLPAPGSAVGGTPSTSRPGRRGRPE